MLEPGKTKTIQISVTALISGKVCPCLARRKQSVGS